MSIPERFNDCPQTNAALRLGHTCKPDHYYTTADHSDKLERQINALRIQLADAIRERDEAQMNQRRAEQNEQVTEGLFRKACKQRDSVIAERDEGHTYVRELISDAIRNAKRAHLPLRLCNVQNSGQYRQGLGRMG